LIVPADVDTVIFSGVSVTTDCWIGVGAPSKLPSSTISPVGDAVGDSARTR
jgi:hypothetical protein